MDLPFPILELAPWQAILLWIVVAVLTLALTTMPAPRPESGTAYRWLFAAAKPLMQILRLLKTAVRTRRRR